jgi:mannose/fructose-specific phosphotransferase system component IIA
MTRSDNKTHHVHGIIVGHGELPQALLGAASAIVGSPDGIATLSNTGLSAVELERRLDALIGATGGAPTVIFVDMYGSSCSTVSLKMRRAHSNLAVVCGVNLPMLLRFIGHRDREDLVELLRAVRNAQANDPTARLEAG